MNLTKLATGVLVSATVFSTVPATADQMHWWSLTSSSRGALEVCTDKGSGDLTSPAKAYEFMKRRGGSYQSLICVLVDADRLAAWDSRDCERVRAAPEVALEVWSRR
jgi:hypothetical protein